MLLTNIHNWLGSASGGAGPVFRWIWASLIAACLAGMIYVGAILF